jgi:CDP-paratose 2-epimerase
VVPVRILITGVCGFVGCTLAESLLDSAAMGQVQILGLDNLSRAGSWRNWERLTRRGVALRHGDIRLASDLEPLGGVDWVIDASANASVLAGVDGRSSSRQLLEHNLFGTINLLEYCKATGAGFVLLSTSRVYSIEPLAALDVSVHGLRFAPSSDQNWPAGIGPAGVSERGPTDAPISLYGASKLASEAVALEFGSTFGFPVWINRCGVLAGAGQFGRADQGIFSFWINAWLRQAPLRFIGFGGTGLQVRDCLHPRDIAPLLLRQMQTRERGMPRICNLSGGHGNSMSLAELSAWCADRFGPRRVSADTVARPFDIPWLVLDHGLAQRTWGWQPQTSCADILDEIAAHAAAHPEWLAVSAAS